MFIGIDASHANKLQRTGVEEYCWQVIQELKKIVPSDCRVVLYSNGNLLPELDQLPANWELKILKWPLKKMWSQFPLAYELWKNPPDVYFSPGQLLPFFAPKNSVVMVHDSAFEAYPNVYRFFGRQYLKWMNRLIVKKSKLILTSTEFNKQEMLKFYDSPHCHSDRLKGVEESLSNKIKVIPLACDSKKFNLEKSAGQNIYGKYILSIGRLEEKKNTARIVEAFGLVKKQFSDLKLVLIGKHGACFEKIQRAIDSSEYKKDIILLGFVEADELLTILKNAQVFVFPSLYEGFGIPVLEAMTVGVPVVVSKGGALEEVGKEAVECVDPLDTKDISEKILNLLQDEEYKKQKIALGLERVKQFSWEKTARETYLSL
ncbi:MAG: glycosyltransferase family 1 protein [Candidatus Magasanikbacteria bacterium]